MSVRINVGCCRCSKAILSKGLCNEYKGDKKKE